MYTHPTNLEYSGEHKSTQAYVPLAISAMASPQAYSFCKTLLCSLVKWKCHLGSIMKIFSTLQTPWKVHRATLWTPPSYRTFFRSFKDPGKKKKENQRIGNLALPLGLLSSLGSLDSLNRKSHKHQQLQASKAEKTFMASRQFFPLFLGVCSNFTVNFSHVHTILEMGHKHLNYIGSIMGTFGSRLCWTLPIPEITHKTFPRPWVM
jgi:hypothetical protein